MTPAACCINKRQRPRQRQRGRRCAAASTSAQRDVLIVRIRCKACIADGGVAGGQARRPFARLVSEALLLAASSRLAVRGPQSAKKEWLERWRTARTRRPTPSTAPTLRRAAAAGRFQGDDACCVHRAMGQSAAAAGRRRSPPPLAAARCRRSPPLPLRCPLQNLVEYISRQKIYDSLYWKQDCFGLSAERLVDKAVELKEVGLRCCSSVASVYVCRPGPRAVLPHMALGKRAGGSGGTSGAPLGWRQVQAGQPGVHITHHGSWAAGLAAAVSACSCSISRAWRRLIGLHSSPAPASPACIKPACIISLARCLPRLHHQPRHPASFPPVSPQVAWLVRRALCLCSLPAWTRTLTTP